MNRIQRLSTFFMAVFGIALAPITATIQPADAQAFRGLILDEFRYDLSADPGDTITRSFTITHDYQPNEDGSDKEVGIFARSLNFIQSDEAGVPQFLEEGTVPFESSLSDWITIQNQSFTLTSLGQVEEVTFTINVPTNAEPGGHFAAVLLGNNLGEQSLEEFQNSGTPGLGINSELGPLIFLTVSGEISKNIDLSNIYTRNIKGDESSFFTNPPVEVVAEFQNTGNVHVIPRGVVTIHRGGKENLINPIASYQLNPDRNAILPNSSREFVIRWGDNDTEDETEEGIDYSGRRSFIISKEEVIRGNEAEGIRLKDGDENFSNYPEIDTEYSTNYDWDHLSKIRIGRYTATVQYDFELVDGTSSDTIIGSTSFTVFPWQIIVVIAIPVILILVYIYYRYRKYQNK